MVRAYSPWPVAFVTVNGERLRIFWAEAAAQNGAAGRFYAENDELYLNLSDGAIRLVSVQAEGKKQMLGREYLIGHRSIVEKKIG